MFKESSLWLCALSVEWVGALTEKEQNMRLSRRKMKLREACARSQPWEWSSPDASQMLIGGQGW